MHAGDAHSTAVLCQDVDCWDESRAVASGRVQKLCTGTQLLLKVRGTSSTLEGAGFVPWAGVLASEK